MPAAPNSNQHQDEEIIDPGLEIIDSHFHLWNAAGHDYFAPDFLADVGSGHRVSASVYIECGMGHLNSGPPELRPVGEIAHVLEQIAGSPAPDHALAAGILGAADLRLGAKVQPVLEACIAAGNGRFKGIRSRAAFDPDPVAGYSSRASGYYSENVLLLESYAEGARYAASLGLVLDVWVFHTQLDDLYDAARKCPDVPVMINHCGGPLGIGSYAGKRAEVFALWSNGIRKLAKLPNVRIKISGLGISRLGFRFGDGGPARSSDVLAAAWKPYILTCVDAFGPERSVFGSNFSVDRAAGSYRMLLNAYKKMLADFSAAERGAIFAENARRFYTLPPAQLPERNTP